MALIKDGEPLLSTRGRIAERDLAVPMLDINTVSAGGGTVAKIDRFGTLQVGPQSAGAVPGPACYGRGGEMPTITDCNLLLGYGAHRNSTHLFLVLPLALSIAFLLISDLDSPRGGIIRVPPQNLAGLAESLQGQ